MPSLTSSGVCSLCDKQTLDGLTKAYSMVGVVSCAGGLAASFFNAWFTCGSCRRCSRGRMLCSWCLLTATHRDRKVPKIKFLSAMGVRLPADFGCPLTLDKRQTRTVDRGYIITLRIGAEDWSVQFHCDRAVQVDTRLLTSPALPDEVTRLHILVGYKWASAQL